MAIERVVIPALVVVSAFILLRLFTHEGWKRILSFCLMVTVNVCFCFFVSWLLPDGKVLPALLDAAFGCVLAFIYVFAEMRIPERCSRRTESNNR